MEAITFIVKEINTLKTKKAKSRMKSVWYDERIAAFENVLIGLRKGKSLLDEESKSPLEKVLERIEPHVENMIKTVQNQKENKTMETIKTTTPAEYIKNMTGVLSDKELIDAIESQIKSNNAQFKSDHICIILENVKITPVQNILLINTYCKSLGREINNEKWKKIYINAGFKRFTDTPTSYSEILLYF